MDVSKISPAPADGTVYVFKSANGVNYWEDSGIKVPVTTVNQEIEWLLVNVVGQSNSQGSSLEKMDEFDLTVDPRVFQLNRQKNKTFNGQTITTYNPMASAKGALIPAMDPLQHHGIADVNSIGFARTYCAEILKDRPNCRIIIVPGALGGTSFQGLDYGGYTVSWDKAKNSSKNLYKENISDVNTLLNNNSKIVYHSTLWLQGESDVGNGMYPVQLQTLVRNYAKDVVGGKAQGKPFILATMSKEWRDSAAVMINGKRSNPTDYIHNSHIWIKYAENIGVTDCVNCDHLVGLTPDGLGVHYPNASLKKIGLLMYAKYKELTAPKSRGFSLTPAPLTWEEQAAKLMYANKAEEKSRGVFVRPDPVVHRELTEQEWDIVCLELMKTEK